MYVIHIITIDDKQVVLHARFSLASQPSQSGSASKVVTAVYNIVL